MSNEPPFTGDRWLLLDFPLWPFWPESDEPMPEVEVRYCPLGPPKREGRVTYAWCPECQRVRKNRLHCPLVEVPADA